jgi:hypothetical protein
LLEKGVLFATPGTNGRVLVILGNGTGNPERATAFVATPTRQCGHDVRHILFENCHPKALNVCNFAPIRRRTQWKSGLDAVAYAIQTATSS